MLSDYTIIFEDIKLQKCTHQFSFLSEFGHQMCLLVC